MAIVYPGKIKVAVGIVIKSNSRGEITTYFPDLLFTCKRKPAAARVYIGFSQIPREPWIFPGQQVVFVIQGKILFVHFNFSQIGLLVAT